MTMRTQLGACVADWQAWVLSYTGTPISEAYVYPLLQPPAATPGNGTEGVLGCVTVVARATDPVSVTLTALQIGTIIAPAGGGPCTGGPITITGTIDTGAGASHVKA